MNKDKLELAWNLRREDPNRATVLINEIKADVEISNNLSDYYDALTIMGIIDIYRCIYDVAEKELIEASEYYKLNPSPLFASRNANNLGMLYIILGDFSKAITVLMNGLEISKLYHINEMTIFILYNLAEIYRDVLDYEKACLLLKEAIELNPLEDHLLSNVLYSSIAICYQNTNELDKALYYTEKSINISETEKDAYSISLCYIVISEIKLQENNIAEAKKYAVESLNIRMQLKDTFSVAVCYSRLAEIALADGFIDLTIDYALLALELVREIHSTVMNHVIYDLLHKAYKANGDINEALKYSELYSQMISSTHDERLQKSLSILSAEQSIERLKKDAEIYRLNSIELQKKSDELLLISKIGKTLINALDFDELILDIYQNVSKIIDAPYFSVGILNDLNQLEYNWVLFNNEKLNPYTVMDEKQSIGYQSIKENRSIYLPHFDFKTNQVERISNNGIFDNIHSVLFSPLYNQDKAIGVLTLQSELEEAYTNDEIILLEGLSSYIAIALENANKATIILNTAKELQETLNHLKETQKQLIHAEKLAGLGKLVAGVAHELNTPIGSTITMISYQLKALSKIKASFKSGELKRQVLDDFLCNSTSILLEVEKAIIKSSEMIQNFKMLALTKNAFVLKSFTINKLQKYIYNSQYEILNSNKIELISNESMDTISTYPVIINDIISHLISNSVNHSFVDIDDPTIYLTINKLNEEVIIKYHDNGVPIPSEIQKNMFEPFYSTKKIDGFMGIGLHAVHNMVTQVLKGTIEYNKGYVIKIKI